MCPPPTTNAADYGLPLPGDRVAPDPSYWLPGGPHGAGPADGAPEGVRGEGVVVQCEIIVKA